MSQQHLKDFKIGSKVVYPSHGIGVIDKIEKKALSGKDVSCYVIRFNGGMTIMAPVQGAVSVGLRRVIGKREITKVFRILKSGKSPEVESNWNKRQKIYQEKIKSGSLYEVAAVYRDLQILRSQKSLSFGEQMVFDNARSLIISEIAEAKGLEEGKVARLVDEATGQPALPV